MDKKTTSKAAEELNVAPSTLRYWESELSNVINISRDENGYRRYSEEDLQQLKTIKNLLYEQNYSIKQVREILNMEEDKQEIAVALTGEKEDNINNLVSILIDKINNLEDGIEELKKGQKNNNARYLESLKKLTMYQEKRDRALVSEIRKKLADKKEQNKNLLTRILPWFDRS